MAQSVRVVVPVQFCVRFRVRFRVQFSAQSGYRVYFRLIFPEICVDRRLLLLSDGDQKAVNPLYSNHMQNRTQIRTRVESPQGNVYTCP
jgi:hypothetical protein